MKRKINKKTISLIAATSISLVSLPLVLVACISPKDIEGIKKQREKEKDLESIFYHLVVTDENDFDYDVIEVSKTNVKDVDQAFVDKNLIFNNEKLELKPNQKIKINLISKDLYYPALNFDFNIYIDDELERTVRKRIAFPFINNPYPIQKDIIQFNNHLNDNNELRLANATQTIGLTFVNQQNNSFVFGNGTWFDYRIKENENYPLTWYIATNSHIAFANKHKNNLEHYAVDDENQQTEFYLSNINTTDIKISQYKDSKNYYKPTDVDISNKKQTFKLTNPITVFAGDDYLETKPHDLNAKIDKDVEEIADLAILEITFENEAIARTITNNIYERAKHDWEWYTLDSKKSKEPFYLINYHQSLYDKDSQSAFNYFFPWNKKRKLFKFYKETSNVSSIGLNKDISFANIQDKVQKINDNISLLTINLTNTMQVKMKGLKL